MLCKRTHCCLCCRKLANHSREGLSNPINESLLSSPEIDTLSYALLRSKNTDWILAPSSMPCAIGELKSRAVWLLNDFVEILIDVHR